MPDKPRPPQTVTGMLLLLAAERRRLGFVYRDGPCTCGQARLGNRCRRDCTCLRRDPPALEAETDGR